MSTQKPLRDVLAVAGNEFRQFKRNRTAIILSLVVLPLFFTVSLGAGLGASGTRFSPTAHLAIAFVDNDMSTASGRLWETLIRSGDFNHLVEGYREDNAIAELGKGQIYAAIIVPKGFQDKLANNQTASIILYADDGESHIIEPTTAALRKSARDFNPYIEVKPTQQDVKMRVQVVQKGVIFSSFNVGLAVVLGVVQIFATFYEIAGGMSKEREEGTYARLMSTPVSLGSVILGKTLYDLGLSAVRTFIILGLSVFVYGARPNTDFGTLLVISLLMALVTIGFGFLVSSLRVGARAIVILEFFLVLAMLLFSGLFVDRELMRGFAKTVSSLLPWTYGFDALKQTILIGQPLLGLNEDLQVIGIAILAFYAIAFLNFAFSRERLLT